MVHSLEENLHTHCPRCGEEHEAKFSSYFESRAHYIIGECVSCGYEIHIKRDDLGAGLFMPDGKVTTVGDSFPEKHTKHMRDSLKGEAHTLRPFSTIRMRFIDG